MKSLRFIALILSLFAALPAPAAKLDDSFKAWLESDIWPKAKANGISREIFDASLSGIHLKLDLPDLVMPGAKLPKSQDQAEFNSPASYFAEKKVAALVSGGKARLGQFGKVLSKIEKQYGVSSGIVLAIWGRESGYGTVKIPFNAFEVLGTKAFMSTRKDLFTKELLAALEIVQRGYATPAMMRSSWAGAMGQPQFLPSSYLQHAVDFDGDGRRDIWGSTPDTLASIAKYLVDYGWQKGRGWGVEVSVPDSVSCALEGPDVGKPLSAWAGAGISPVSGEAFSKADMKLESYLLAPAGRLGPLFIATPNFYIIKQYNNSDLYALFIGNVADRITSGGGAFQGRWQDIGKLTRHDVAGMQKFLEGKGYDIGSADGLPGFKTRRSIGDFQAKSHLAPECYPVAALKSVLR